jgi:hypothetical protein
MGIAAWISHNWFELFSVIGIISGLWFTAVSLHSETKTRRIANLLTITTNHRELWKELFHIPELTRVLDASADIAKQPVTPAEEMFVNMVILHINSVYYAMNDELLMKLEGLRRDIAYLFSLPIPKAVWRKTKRMQNEDFTRFIDETLS